MEKKDRMLAILYRFIKGEKIIAARLADEYKVSSKSILRDIREIEKFFLDNRELVGNAEVVSGKKGEYGISQNYSLQGWEVLTVMKILLGCRALEKKEVRVLADKLSEFVPGEDYKKILSLLKGELDFYQPVKVNSRPVLETLARLEDCIRTGKAVRIEYTRLDGKQVERKLYPIATSFVGHYFYLGACIAGKDGSSVVYYRIDRMGKLEELDERIPMDIEARRGKEASRMYVQDMFMGERTRIRFRYTGPSVQAICDRFPTAEIICQDDKGVEFAAMVEYSRGTMMELMSQGSWIQVLAPPKLVEDMEKELEETARLYKQGF